MITTLVVIVVCSLLGVASVSIADHAVSRSGRERSRSAALHAAEAGVHAALGRLAAANGATWCGQPASDDTLVPRDPSSPGGEQWSATVADSNGVAGTCDAVDPVRVVTATGWSPRADAPGAVSRTLRAVVRRAPGQAQLSGAAAFPDAVFSGSASTPPVIGGETTVLSDGLADDADVVSEADATVTLAGPVQGDVVAAGDVDLEAAEVAGRVQARGSVTVGDGALVGGDTTSSTGGVSLVGRATIAGDATAAGDVSVSAAGWVGGAVRSGEPTSPPAQRSLPEFSFDPSAWPGPLTTWADCATFLAYVQAHVATLGGTHRIVQDCPLVLDAAALPGLTLSVSANLAIVTDGTIALRDGVLLQRAGGSAKTATLVSLHAPGGDTDGIEVTGGSGFRNLPAFLFAANRVTRLSSLPLTGQIAADTVVLGGTGALTFRPFTPPGFSVVSADPSEASGYHVSVESVTEVTGQP